MRIAAAIVLLSLLAIAGGAAGAATGPRAGCMVANMQFGRRPVTLYLSTTSLKCERRTDAPSAAPWDRPAGSPMEGGQDPQIGLEGFVPAGNGLGRLIQVNMRFHMVPGNTSLWGQAAQL